MRWRVTIRATGVELRGYIDAPLAELEQLAQIVKPLGVMIASPAADDYDPFGGASPTAG
jgi:hypothetical protein